MKKFVVLGLIIVTGLLIAAFAIPAIADESETEATTQTHTEWHEKMQAAWEAEDGDALLAIMKEMHGDDFAGMPFNGEGGFGHMAHMGAGYKAMMGGDFTDMPCGFDGDFDEMHQGAGHMGGGMGYGMMGRSW